VGLVAVLGVCVLFGASASAKLSQTITFASVPPSDAVVGGTYEVSASASSQEPVALEVKEPETQKHSACRFGAPATAGSEQHLSSRGRQEPRGVEGLSPQSVYFVGAGTCTITAIGVARGGAAYAEYENAPEVEQTFTVAKNPGEHVRFSSTPPSHAKVGGSYNPALTSSAGIFVSFFAATPSVCSIREDVEHPRVEFYEAGICRLIASQADNQSAALVAPEATQSFRVRNLVTTARKPKAVYGWLTGQITFVGGPGCGGPCKPDAGWVNVATLGGTFEAVKHTPGGHPFRIRLPKGVYEVWTGKPGEAPAPEGFGECGVAKKVEIHPARQTEITMDLGCGIP
jgi:hypothetical protein